MILLPLHEWVHTCSQQAEHGNVMKYPLFLLQAPYQRRLVVHFRGLGSGFGVFEDKDAGDRSSYANP
jgi:hypothetical protein